MTQDFSNNQASNGKSGELRELDVQTLNGLNAWGTVSYILHLVVAVAEEEVVEVEQPCFLWAAAAEEVVVQCSFCFAHLHKRRQV